MKDTIITIIVALLIGGALFLMNSQSGNEQVVNVNNVSIVDGKQIIVIRAKGGYQPRTSYAQSNLPTILRFDTNGTFDCSSSVRIPSLGITKMLPQSGSTDIDIGTSPPSTLSGMCGMGMYPFDVVFK